MVYSRLSRRLRELRLPRVRRPTSRCSKPSHDGERVAGLHQLADHQPDLVLPRGAPLPGAGRARAQARSEPVTDLVRGRLDRRGAVFDRDDADARRSASAPPAAHHRHRHRHRGAGQGRGRRLSAGAGRPAVRRAAAALLPARAPARNAGKVRVRPELAAMVKFARLNLLDPTWPVHGAVRRDLLPQRDDLFRQADADARCCERFAPLLKPRRAAVRRPLGERLAASTRPFRRCGQTVYELAHRRASA